MEAGNYTNFTVGPLRVLPQDLFELHPALLRYAQVASGTSSLCSGRATRAWLRGGIPAVSFCQWNRACMEAGAGVEPTYMDLQSSA